MLSLASMPLPSSVEALNHRGERSMVTMVRVITPVCHPSGGVDVGDHPPITPMRSANRDQLRDNEWKLYDFITRHFLATVRTQ